MSSFRDRIDWFFEMLLTGVTLSVGWPAILLIMVTGPSRTDWINEWYTDFMGPYDLSAMMPDA